MIHAEFVLLMLSAFVLLLLFPAIGPATSTSATKIDIV